MKHYSYLFSYSGLPTEDYPASTMYNGVINPYLTYYTYNLKVIATTCKTSQSAFGIRGEKEKGRIGKLLGVNYNINETIYSIQTLPKTWPAIILPSSPATAARAFLWWTYWTCLKSLWTGQPSVLPYIEKIPSSVFFTTGELRLPENTQDVMERMRLVGDVAGHGVWWLGSSHSWEM